MAKTFLYRLFGLGKIPKEMRPIFEAEGILLVDEGIGGSVTLRNFRSPTRISSWRRSGFCGSLVLTKVRFAGFKLFGAVINVPFEREWLDKLECSVEGDSKLCVIFDAADFHDGWSGTIEVRFSTPHAYAFLDRLTDKVAKSTN